MYFEKNRVYHIYNQGNNRQKIFFRDENYLFFLRKMREFVTPYGDFLCYCLMPNHFHWLVYVRETSIAVTDRLTGSQPVSYPAQPARIRTLNASIAILLRSYTRAINNQERRTGSLFREETKAKNGWQDPHIIPSHPDYGEMLRQWESYGKTCFHYIHNNPVKTSIDSDCGGLGVFLRQRFCGTAQRHTLQSGIGERIAFFVTNLQMARPLSL